MLWCLYTVCVLHSFILEAYLTVWFTDQIDCIFCRANLSPPTLEAAFTLWYSFFGAIQAILKSLVSTIQTHKNATLATKIQYISRSSLVTTWINFTTKTESLCHYKLEGHRICPLVLDTISTSWKQFFF